MNTPNEAHSMQFILHILNTSTTLDNNNNNSNTMRDDAAPAGGIDTEALRARVAALAAERVPGGGAGRWDPKGTDFAAALRTLLEQRRITLAQANGRSYVSLPGRGGGGGVGASSGSQHHAGAPHGTTAATAAAAPPPSQSSATRAHGVSGSSSSGIHINNNSNASIHGSASRAPSSSSLAPSGGGGGGAVGSFESESASLVLEALRARGGQGVDQQTLQQLTRIPKAELVKVLHYLQYSQRRVQEVRSFTNKARRVYLLADVMPDVGVTGGFFYCGEALDVPLVDALRSEALTHVCARYQQAVAGAGAGAGVTLADIERHLTQWMQGQHQQAWQQQTQQTPQPPQPQQLSVASHSSSPPSPAPAMPASYSQGSATILSSPVSAHAGGGFPDGLPSGRGGGAAAAPYRSRVMTIKDVFHLVRSLVYDGVLLETYHGQYGGGLRVVAPASNDALQAARELYSYVPATAAGVVPGVASAAGGELLLGGGESVVRFFTVRPRATCGAVMAFDASRLSPAAARAAATEALASFANSSGGGGGASGAASPSSPSSARAGRGAFVPSAGAKRTREAAEGAEPFARPLGDDAEAEAPATTVDAALAAAALISATCRDVLSMWEPALGASSGSPGSSNRNSTTAGGGSGARAIPGAAPVKQERAEEGGGEAAAALLAAAAAASSASGGGTSDGPARRQREPHTVPGLMAASGLPCLGCPQLARCFEGGLVNPKSCAYLAAWAAVPDW